MLRDCRDAKCLGCGKLGHIAPYCPGRQERLRSAVYGRFGHNKEECNANNYNNKCSFPQRGMSPNALNVRNIEPERGKEGRTINIGELGEKNMECFRCRKGGHVARDCENM
ncbi:CCHC-type zinc finger nucleic acid binding protein-like [Gordionus sp. m RMFG-2023]|uniref:CCHC-type zinc finger nucleic acid binding protein-like n=1 Tax=Gordionus sp. m RMFG-2023 TaxID=3053472 RepID=UPI0031FD2DF8